MITHLLPQDIRWWGLEFDIVRLLGVSLISDEIYCSTYYDPIFLGC